MIEKEFTKNLLKRLRMLGGQIKGLEKMIAENRPPFEILVQLLAILGGITKLTYQQFDEAIRKSLALKLVSLLQANNLPPSTRQRLEFIRKNFPDYTFKQLPKVLYEVDQIENQITNKQPNC